MTNLQRQKQLDEQKYLVSEAKQSDQSGFMAYCDYCAHKQNGCGKSQLEKEMNCICATAYNRMVRARKKK